MTHPGVVEPGQKTKAETQAATVTHRPTGDCAHDGERLQASFGSMPG